ncbi:MAG: acyl-CoA thioesterase [Desulforhopalus sp.]|nr:acyl-CoA thioesterase [Desulforhopalus sp.]
MVYSPKYFPVRDGDPAPLVAMAKRRVRFEEVDVLGMVWHGHYASFFEDGRIAFGDIYGLTYQTYRDNNVMAPVVQMHLDYKIPLRFDEEITIETALHWAETARMNFSYLIYNGQGQLATSAYTVQLLTDPQGTLQLYTPDWLVEFKERWRQGAWPKP